jgi:catechol 2,3-dioxygenase-like lactoylglutathione lyase family enzyme
MNMLSTTALFCLLGFGSDLNAQDSDSLSYSFDHVALSVTDVEASAQFYEELFGLRQIMDRTPMDGVRWLTMPGGGELHLLAIVPGEVLTTQAVHLAVRTTDFDRLLATITEMGVEYTTWLGISPGITERDDGTRQIYVKDPDGYWVEIIGTPD